MNIYDKENSPEYLKGIFETAGEGIIVVDADGRILKSNPAFGKLLGYEKDELKGKLFTEIAHKDAKVQKITSTSKIHHFHRSSEFPMEMELVNKEEIFVQVRLRSVLIKDDEGKVVESIGMVEDLRENKGEEVLQQKVLETQETLQNVLTNSGDAIMVADANGHITIANEALLLMLGYQEDEILGRHLVELSPYEGNFTTTTEEVVSITEEYLNYQVEKANELFEKGKVTNYELYLIRKDGKIVPVEATISVLKDQNGERRGSITIFRDVTERRKTERELKETKDFLENVIKNTADGIMICDLSGNIVDANSALEKMTGLKKEELIGKHASILIKEDKEIRKIFRERAVELFETGYTSYESVIRKMDGKNVDVEYNCSLIKDDKGNYIAGVSIIRDITERKKMEQQLLQTEKLKSLGELAGGVAHDFNNVLAAILGRVQLLRMQMETPLEKKERRRSIRDLKKSLEVIEKASLDGAETVRRIQEFSRVREDDKHSAAVDLNKVIEDALEFTKVRWKNEVETKGIIIHIKKELLPLSSMAGSAPELREVFINLINNAIDAMPRGGEIRIKTLMDNRHAVIKLEDTGIGITKALSDRIFDPFFTTKGPQSTGLGLSVSYGIINRHRGTIMVNSIEGQGTTFTIKFPLSKHTGKEEKVINRVNK